MKSFLSCNDPRGKNPIPFPAHGGWFAGSGFRDVRRLRAGCSALDGLSLRGDWERDGAPFVMEGEQARQPEREVTHWLDSLAVR